MPYAALWKNLMEMDSLFENEVNLEQLLPLMQEYLKNGKRVTFSPRGVSMLPMLRQGRDTVTVSPVPGKLRKYDLPLYRRDNGRFVLHRIVKVGETYTCIGDNQFEAEAGIRQDQLIGLVTSFQRDGREYRVEDMRYRLYCSIWHHSRGLRHFYRRSIGWIRRQLK